MDPAMKKANNVQGDPLGSLHGLSDVQLNFEYGGDEKKDDISPPGARGVPPRPTAAEPEGASKVSRQIGMALATLEGVQVHLEHLITGTQRRNDIRITGIGF
jgi:hypothetical protein